MGCKQSMIGNYGTLRHPRVTKSAPPGTGTIARMIALGGVILGCKVSEAREKRRVRRGARGYPMKRLRYEAKACQKVERRERRRKLKRRRRSRCSGRGRRAGPVSKRLTGHDRASVRHGATVLFRHETAERLGCTMIVQPLGFLLPTVPGMRRRRVANSHVTPP